MSDLRSPCRWVRDAPFANLEENVSWLCLQVAGHVGEARLGGGGGLVVDVWIVCCGVGVAVVICSQLIYITLWLTYNASVFYGRTVYRFDRV